MMYLKECANLEGLKRRIANSFAPASQEAADALRALIDELEAAEVEVDMDMFTEKVKEILAAAEPNEKTTAAIAEAIAKRMQAVTNTAKGATLSVKVKNEIAAAILRADNKEAVKDAVNKVLVKNDISGLTFEDVVDYAIVENWGDLNPIFKQLHKTMFTKFFYNDDELQTASLIAKQWDKTGNAEKTIQDIEATGKTISTKYIYKRQRAAQEDLDEIEKAGQTSNFLRFINEELDRMIVNTIVMAILVGDTINAVGKRVTSFETIGTKTTDDVFTSIVNPETEGDVALSDFRALADAVKNPYGKRKILITSTKLLSIIAKFVYASGGSEVFHAKEDVAKMIGVDEIITSDLIQEGSGMYGICMLPDGYWYNEKNAISVAYPKYEENVMNYQKERNIGGAIHDLYSTAVLKDAEY